ncbi:MAG: trehalase family glycosidase [Trueperaceae bacterium]
MSEIDDSDSEARYDRLIERAATILADNHTGLFTKPSAGQYPHQWNWDSAFIAVGLGHIDRRRAFDELRTLLRAQWANGMVPHILYPHGASNYFPTPEFWQTRGAPGGPPIETSGFTQPPLVASAVRRLYERADDEEAAAFAREVYPSLLAWHRWLHGARDPDGTGLIAIIHPWESGTDNSTRFAAPLERLGEVAAPPYSRQDQHFVKPGERPEAGDYDRFMYLIGRYRAQRWDDETVYREAPFLVQDVLFNSLVYRDERDLRVLAERLGEPVAEIDGWLAAAASAFDRRLWHESAGLYYDWDVRAGRAIEESTCAALMPLYAGVADADKAGRLVRHQLLDPGRYAPGEGSRYFLPSVSKSSPYFEPRRYWRGPIWLNINWLLISGLREYGYLEEAAAIRRDTIELVERSGFVEYYDPRDGSPCGAAGFSWSAALLIDLLMEKN